MIGAIEILQKWRKICFEHTKEVKGVKHCECENCELKKYCVPHPRNISLGMINEVVKIIDKKDIEL